MTTKIELCYGTGKQRPADGQCHAPYQPPEDRRFRSAAQMRNFRFGAIYFPGLNSIRGRRRGNNIS